MPETRGGTPEGGSRVARDGQRPRDEQWPHEEVRGPVVRPRRGATDADPGAAHVRDSGRRTARGAVVWHACYDECPPDMVTPKGSATR